MKSLHLICVGKLKDKSLSNIENDYIKRIKNPNLVIHEVKASATDMNTEGRAVLKKIEALSSEACLILLTEFGKTFESPEFSNWLTQIQETQNQIVFVICGAEGPSLELKERAHTTLSLSPLTFPHKIARILLTEQIYRAQTIQSGHPYHN